MPFIFLQDALPITDVAVGGMAKNGQATVKVSSLRCTKRPVGKLCIYCSL